MRDSRSFNVDLSIWRFVAEQGQTPDRYTPPQAASKQRPRSPAVVPHKFVNVQQAPVMLQLRR